MKQRYVMILVMIVLGTVADKAVPAAFGTVTHLKSHDNEKVVTDPSRGFTLYPRWVVFPPVGAEYRKVVLYVTYRCPQGLHCGEWDYIDAVQLKRMGSSTAAPRTIEIARLISPYGWKFDSTWSFTWHVDVTDFAFLLHDSVEVEFKHTGYESNTDRGWLVTVDFELTEGISAIHTFALDTLWCGTFPYGDTSNPLESLLKKASFFSDTATMVRLRIHQTGHGMDDSANCAEFCSKYRQVKFDDSLVDQRQIWRTCGDNPLYPQSGTWIYNRANWCPGSIVFPDIYDFPVSPRSSHTIDIDMEPYINPNKPSANYYIQSYLFRSARPWAKNDVSLEEITVPGSASEYARLNPACAEPSVLIKNNGNLPLSSVEVIFGSEGDSVQTITWLGHLGSQKTTTVLLPGPIPSTSGQGMFRVTLALPNGLPDEYPHDNVGSSAISAPPVLPSQFILALRTNKEPGHNEWRLTDGSGNSIRERALGSLKPFTNYRDTFTLTPGCYLLTLSDTAGDGLNFWYNVEGGYGYARLIDLNGHLIKGFQSDFGSEIRYWFTVGETPPAIVRQPPVVEPFPPRHKGRFDVDLFFDRATTIDLNIVSDSSKSAVYSRRYQSIRDTLLSLDISSSPDGVYWLNVIAGKDTTTRRLRLRHSD
ncbi:MAG: peptide-N-glycosidase [candidate division Zixibacteria bacterium]|nr:peptide-N-glycosidase [candidate division Zixibacteria bacterium]